MNEQLQRDIQAYLVAHPNARVLEICAEFDLTDEEAVRELHALRGRPWPGPIWPREDRSLETKWLRETEETRREANWRPGQE